MTALSLRTASPPGARILAATGLVAFLLFNYVLVATARLHATIARALLRAPEDPLREAKEMLHRHGPLDPSNPNIRADLADCPPVRVQLTDGSQLAAFRIPVTREMRKIIMRQAHSLTPSIQTGQANHPPVRVQLTAGWPSP